MGSAAPRVLIRKTVSYIPTIKRPTRTATSLAKASAKSQPALPRAKRSATTIDKASAESGDPFATFTEWSSEADEKAYDKF